MRTSEATIEMKEVTGLELTALAKLRFDVWSATGELALTSFRESDWIDSHDMHATHGMVWEGSQLVAAIRVCLHRELSEIPDIDFYPQDRGIRKTTDLPAACLNRLVIQKRVQRSGLGRRLIALGVEWSKERKARTVVVSTNPRLSTLLREAGFIPIGEPTIDPKKPALPLQFMLLRLFKSSEARPLAK